MDSDVMAQVKAMFADDADLLEQTDWKKVELFSGIRRGIDREYGHDTAGPVGEALGVVLDRLSDERDPNCPPPAASLRRASERLQRLAELQEAGESQLMGLV